MLEYKQNWMQYDISWSTCSQRNNMHNSQEGFTDVAKAKRNTYKPPIIIRKGNQFVINERRILPYLRSSMNYIEIAVSIAFKEYKENASKYKYHSPEQKLKHLNDMVYYVLTKWSIFRG